MSRLMALPARPPRQRAADNAKAIAMAGEAAEQTAAERAQHGAAGMIAAAAIIGKGAGAADADAPAPRRRSSWCIFFNISCLLRRF